MMTSEDLNQIIRELFTKLIDSGYKKLPICNVTLGQNFSPQFDKFIKGTDLGLGPLTRILDGLGHNMALVPVKDDDKEFKQQIQKKYQEFIGEANTDLIDFLENRTTPQRTATVSKYVEGEVDDLINEIESEV